jgi:cyclopropane-fatty-acyl-phospholipid synthase
MKIGIIGGGITGITSANKLSLDNDITLFEKNEKLGGHTITENIDGKTIDIGFQVMNKQSYPNLMKWFWELGVETTESCMSLSVNSNFTWGTKSLLGFFGYFLKNILNFRFWLMIYDLLRFYNHGSNYNETSNVTINEFCKKKKYSKSFLNNYLIPFCSCVWSMNPNQCLEMPMNNFIKFMKNHSFLSLWSLQWYVVKNGSSSYIDKALKNVKVKKNCEVLKIVPKDKKVIVHYKDNFEVFDKVIVAVHGDIAYKLLNYEYLKNIKYTKNNVVLHCDDSLMPNYKKSWSSWNFKYDKNNLIVTYWCNSLYPHIKYNKNYFITLNPNKKVKNILKSYELYHPLINNELEESVKNIKKNQGDNNIWLCGAYMGHGFHEDGHVSALEVVKSINKSINKNDNESIMKPLFEKGIINRILVNKFVNKLKNMIKKGTIILNIGGYGTEIIGEDYNNSSLKANMIVYDSKAIWKILFKNDIGFSEAYILKYFDTDDMHNLLRIFILNRELGHSDLSSDKYSYFLTKINYFKHLFRNNNINNSKENIKKHYDLSNKMFSNFLDKSLTYSCAYFKNTKNLYEAQMCKYDRIIKKLQLKETDHVLEVGCGWGGFMIRAVEKIGCKVTAVTLSKKQYDVCKRKIKEKNLDNKINLLLMDYRNIKGKYDKIVSIEMLEAVGYEFLDEYFSKLKTYCKPNGILVIQTISLIKKNHDKQLKESDFLREYIFPGSNCNSFESISKSAEKFDWNIQDVKEIGLHYAKTLKMWDVNFMNNKNKIINEGFDENFIRMFHYYFKYCESAFSSRIVKLYQITFSTSHNLSYEDKYLL